DLTAVDVPGQVNEEIIRLQMLFETGIQIVGRNAASHKGHALFDPGPQRAFIRLEIHYGDTLWIDMDGSQQNRERTARDRTETDEQDSVRKCQHSGRTPSSGHSNLFTSTFEFRPLCSYFSLRAGGRSSGAASTKPALD